VATTSCPHCGERIETFPDPGGPGSQQYVEDCSVCCRPILFIAVLDESGDWAIEASREV
jgi:hypothetical protein